MAKHVPYHPLPPPLQPPPPPHDAPALPPPMVGLSVDEIKIQIRLKTVELLGAPSQRAAQLTLELQRLRVAKLLMMELDGQTSPDLFKELNLLNRMEKGSDPLAETERVAAEQDEARSNELLKEKGLSPESAQRLARVLNAAAATVSSGNSEPTSVSEETDSGEVEEEDETDAVT